MIGLNLGVPQHTLVSINLDCSNCTQCMSEMLAKWLQKVDETSIPSWRSLCQALFDVDRSTANQIAKKYHITDYNKQKGITMTLNIIIQNESFYEVCMKNFMIMA